MQETKKNRVEFSGCSYKGLRQENQDAFIVNYPENNEELIHKGIIACIADGVSCSDKSQQASHTATTQFTADYYATPLTWNVSHSVSEILLKINNWLYNQGKDHLNHNGMVTTLSTVIIKSNTAHLFHIGDSRIYLFRNNHLTQLTQDHQRVNIGKQHYLTRALGMDVNIDLDYQTIKLQMDDIVILTTDGVHETLQSDEIIQYANNTESAELLSRILCESALNKGSTDNATCIVLKVTDLPDMTMFEHQQKLLSRAIPPALTNHSRLDHFEIIKTLYDGTRSHVYLAVDTQTEDQVVIKVPSLNYQEEPDTLKLFANEYWIASHLKSPRVMQMYPCPENTKFIYQICEYIEGVTLRQWMLDHPNPDLNTVRELIDSIVKAIRVFQRADMVHRDLKPENIMVTKNNEVKIIDFGAVEVKGLTESYSEESPSFPLGSVNYTAPEYINTGKATIFSDLFSIGVIGYEMLCGKLPYKEHSQQTLQQARHIKWQYRPIQQFRDDIPLWIDLALQKATAEIPEKRYQALGDFIVDLFTPNARLLHSANNRTLLKHNPVLFWKCVALLTGFIAIIEGLFLL